MILFTSYSSKGNVNQRVGKHAARHRMRLTVNKQCSGAAHAIGLAQAGSVNGILAINNVFIAELNVSGHAVVVTQKTIHRSRFTIMRVKLRKILGTQ